MLTKHFDVAASKCGMAAVFAKGSMVCSCDPEKKIHQAGTFSPDTELIV